MRIESVDLFYLAMPEITDAADGSQDALLVRVRGGGFEGWGECEAAPLPCIAAWCCPSSHGYCKPVMASVLGARIDGPDDIRRLNAEVRRVGLDLLQTDHTLSGIDVALWDWLGRARGEPVYRVLGDRQAYPKLAYASVLFGDTPEQTLLKAKDIRAQGFRAAKFGWGPYGRTTPGADADQVQAAREGLGPEGVLLVDAGTVWQDDVEAAISRMPALQAAGASWLEEPFRSEATDAYGALVGACPGVSLAAGEGAHNLFMARDLVSRAGIRYLQIDAGRIGGITTAFEARELCRRAGTTYVNHTFTSHLALSASLQPYAGIEDWTIAEFPTELTPLARDLTIHRLSPDGEGRVRLPEGPGLGVAPDRDTVRRYLVPVRIECAGKVLYATPPVD